MRKTLKWIGIALGSLIGLLAIALIVLNFVGSAKANKIYEIAGETVTIPTDAAAIQRGQHVAIIYTCTNCHTANLGGELGFVVPGMVSIPTPNLTSGAGGIAPLLSDEDWLRAIRHGVGHDGRGLLIMPAQGFNALSAADLGALIAYLKSVPPVDNQLPERRIELLGRLMMAVGLFPAPAVEKIDHTSPPGELPMAGVSIASGRYLTRTCLECHGANLNGAPFGPPGQEVPSPNLTPGGELAGWTEEQFFTTIRTGFTPGGHQLSEDMPWVNFGQMTDEELSSVWLYLQSLPALEQGG